MFGYLFPPHLTSASTATSTQPIIVIIFGLVLVLNHPFTRRGQVFSSPADFSGLGAFLCGFFRTNFFCVCGFGVSFFSEPKKDDGRLFRNDSAALGLPSAFLNIVVCCCIGVRYLLFLLIIVCVDAGFLTLYKLVCMSRDDIFVMRY